MTYDPSNSSITVFCSKESGANHFVITVLFCVWQTPSLLPQTERLFLTHLAVYANSTSCSMISGSASLSSTSKDLDSSMLAARRAESGATTG